MESKSLTLTDHKLATLQESPQIKRVVLGRWSTEEIVRLINIHIEQSKFSNSWELVGYELVEEAQPDDEA